MGIYGYTGEKEQRQQVRVKLLANTGADTLSPRAVVILGRGMSRFPVLQEHPGFPRALGWMACQCLLPATTLQWRGTGEGVTFPFQSLNLLGCSSPLGIPIRNANGWKGGWGWCRSELGRELLRPCCASVSPPPQWG